MTVAEAQAFCLEQGIPFYSYRLPGEQESDFGAQLEGGVAPFRQIGERGRGFVLVPFAESEKVSSWFIRGDVTFRQITTDAGIRESLSRTVGGNDSKPGLEPDVSREEYENQVATVVEALKQGKVRKVVLSRTVTLQERAYEKAAAWYAALAGRYPEAFVFLVFVPGGTCWLGATPEIFLRQSEAETETMALAGTRKAGIREAWGQKEIEEQAIVTDYIAEVLSTVCGEGWQREGPFSKQAGQVEHLCTTFRRAGRLTTELTGRVCSALHPTPAVGGVPVGSVLPMIRRIEGRDRRYYAGYVGPVSDSGCWDWFVNLRCMELWPDKIRLYVGGGITALSDPRKEWEETELKSRTLLDILQNSGK